MFKCISNRVDRIQLIIIVILNVKITRTAVPQSYFLLRYLETIWEYNDSFYDCHLYFLSCVLCIGVL